MAQNSVKALVLSTFNSASVTGTYQSINSPGFTKPPFFVRIVNASNTAITVSYDGINDNEYIPANGVFELPSQANAQPKSEVALFPARTQVYIKGAAGAGTITLSGYYV